ncbi:MAG: hypothetical protein JKY29_06895, partial [Gammaproteobacteria bacterium]|nr:hypothetical protein [Gammaproteobacteria bacterium]
MTETKKIAGLAVATLLTVLNSANAQNDALVLDDDVPFNGDFTFDDDLFSSAFDEDSSANTSSWLDDFTVKISQQFSGQINNHTIEVAPGISLPREAELETNR